jgi:glucosylglycerate synthase
MATADPIPVSAPAEEPTSAPTLVLLAAMPQEQIEATCAHLAEVFAPDEILVAAPESLASQAHTPLRVIAAPQSHSSWTLTAADFVHTSQLMQAHGATAALLLGPEADSLAPAALRALADAIAGGRDLAVPSYELPPHAGLVNSAILYPLSRALFATRPRFPLAVDLGRSARMATRLALPAQRLVTLKQSEAPLWPLSEAAAAAFNVSEVPAGKRVIPQPSEPDLNTILPLILSSLFADVEAKAPFWQRPRPLPPAHSPIASSRTDHDTASDTASMVQAFKLGYGNLLEIWSLVLPPNTLLGLKRLSQLEAQEFDLPHALWARIVYDFLIAWRLRTLNRSHLLGAMIPLYLAWVASHIHNTLSGSTTEQHVEAAASAFESEKPYLVSRWRWPDRFNP